MRKLCKDMMPLVNMLSYRQKKSLSRELWRWVEYQENGKKHKFGRKPLTVREWSRKGMHKR